MAVSTALVGLSAGRYHVVHNTEIPPLKPDMMLCKVVAIALNPADAKISDFSPAAGSIAGFDFAGEVVQVGSRVKRFDKGDRIFGVACGHSPDDQATGAFSDYVLATEDLACRIPVSMSFEQASTLGLAVATAGCALYNYLEFPLPDTDADTERNIASSSKKPYVLVSGGLLPPELWQSSCSNCRSLSIDSIAPTPIVQLQPRAPVTLTQRRPVSRSGLQPIATCSPQSTAMVKSLGAVATFDYHSPSCGTEINSYTKGSLSHALDCVSSAETTSMCYEAIGAAGGRYLALDPISTHVQYTRRDVYADWMVGVTVFGCAVKFAGVYGRPAMPEHRQLAARLYPLVESLVCQGKLKGPRFQIRSGGLAALEDGIEDVRKGRVRGGKLVYPLA